MLRWQPMLKQVRPNRDPDRSVHVPCRRGGEGRSSWGLPPLFCRWAYQIE